MDQIRTALAWIKRHHFWLLGVLVPLIALGAWYMGAADLQKKTTEGMDTIKKAFNDQNQLAGKPFYPNEDVNNHQREQIDIQANQVEQIWQQLYDRQREAVLKWPEDLGQGFADHMQNRTFGDLIRDDMRSAYQNYAKRSFGELPAIVGAKEVEIDPGAGGFGGGGFGGFGRGGFGGEGGGFGGFGGMEGMGGFEDPLMDDDSIVKWHDQGTVKAQLMFTERPSSIKIWVTQEDLWVYETLLRAIAATNEKAGADRYSNAAVRDIGLLQVGKDAAKESRTKGRIKMRTPLAAGGGMEGEFGGMEGRGMAEGDPNMGMPGEEFLGLGERGFGDGPMTEEQERQLLLTGRYIDGEGKPMPVTADAGSFNPSIFGVEYKRLPVRMVLQMDQRWLSFLITQLASAPLQVEVQEVRINPSSVDSAGGGIMGGGEGGRGGFGGGFGGEGGFGGGGNEMVYVFERQPNLTTIIIQGTIYIFNKPDESQLQPEGAEGAVDPSLATLGSPEQGVVR